MSKQSMAALTSHFIALILSVTCIAAGRAPKLTISSEHTHTREVRDIAFVGDTVWAATSGGIAVHRRTDGRFVYKLTTKDGLPGNSIYTLLVLEGKSVQAGGAFGTATIRVDGITARAVVSQTAPTAPDRFDPVFDLIKADGRVMRLGFQSGITPYQSPVVGGWAGGMWRAGARNNDALITGGLDGRLMVRFDDPTKAPNALHLEEPVLDIATHENGFLIATGSGLLLYDVGRIKPLRRISPVGDETRIAATALDVAGEGALVGTAAGELIRLDEKGMTLLGAVNGRITSLEVDGDRIWLGVAGKGLMVFDIATQAVVSLNPQGEICSNHITRMTRHCGVLVAGSFDEGVCLYREGVWTRLEEQRSPYVHGVASDGENLWVATSSGLMRYNAEFVPAPITDADPMALNWYAASAVTAAREVGAGRVLLGSPWGSVLIHRRGDDLNVEFISRKQGSPPHLTQVAALDDTLFFSSESHGVRAVLPNGEQQHFLDPVHLPEAWVLDIAPVAGDIFWAATCQRGVAYVSGGDSVVVNRTRGLSDDRTIAVVPHGKGAFVTTLGGLSYVSRTGEAAPAADPLIGDPRGASLYLDGETLWHGTESGLVHFSLK
jgi:hypothetical protein